MSNTYYVLTEGDYDEYHILGVFDENGMREKKMSYFGKAKEYIFNSIKSYDCRIHSLQIDYNCIENGDEFEIDPSEIIKKVNALEAEKAMLQETGKKREIKKLNKKINNLQGQKKARQNEKKYKLNKIQFDIDALEKEKNKLVNMSEEEMLDYYFENSYEGLNFEPYKLNECENSFYQNDYDDEDDEDD